MGTAQNIWGGSENNLYGTVTMDTCMHAQSLQSCLTLWPYAPARQTPLTMGFSRQEYWSGLLCPPSGDLPDQGIKPVSPALQAILYCWDIGESQWWIYVIINLFNVIEGTTLRMNHNINPDLGWLWCVNVSSSVVANVWFL